MPHYVPGILGGRKKYLCPPRMGTFLSRGPICVSWPKVATLETGTEIDLCQAMPTDLWLTPAQPEQGRGTGRTGRCAVSGSSFFPESTRYWVPSPSHFVDLFTGSLVWNRQRPQEDCLYVVRHGISHHPWLLLTQFSVSPQGSCSPDHSMAPSRGRC